MSGPYREPIPQPVPGRIGPAPIDWIALLAVLARVWIALVAVAAHAGSWTLCALFTTHEDGSAVFAVWSLAITVHILSAGVAVMWLQDRAARAEA